ncbi:MAG: hypothetical protein IJU16_07220 [Clostridia bacterium]|nr:hypothetical protein [Clostridia bacterium]
MIATYIRIYMKRNIWLAFVCATMVFIPLFIASLIYDYVPYDIALSFILFGLAFICVLLSLLPTVRFKNMIANQEKQYAITFSDNHAEHLETTLYLSDEWLIWAGSCALYKKHIKSAKPNLEAGRAGMSYRITLHTKDGKRYIIWCLNHTNKENVLTWYHSSVSSTE